MPDCDTVDIVIAETQEVIAVTANETQEVITVNTTETQPVVSIVVTDTQESVSLAITETPETVNVYLNEFGLPGVDTHSFTIVRDAYGYITQKIYTSWLTFVYTRDSNHRITSITDGAHIWTPIYDVSWNITGITVT